MAMIIVLSPLAQEVEVMHQRMLKEIASDFRSTENLTGRKKMQPAVEQAMAAVRRHEFVSTSHSAEAYLNRPLPIGQGQTISQPFIVAIMTDLLDLKFGSRVLEIGTGSGYQAAVLAEITDEVFTIEIVEPLAQMAAARLKRLGYNNIQIKIIAIRVLMFPNFAEALDVKIAPNIATICMSKMLIIKPIVFSVSFAQAISCSPK